MIVMGSTQTWPVIQAICEWRWDSRMLHHAT
jgi:hypothetical protein